MQHLKDAGSHIKEGDIVLVRTDFVDWYYHLPNFLEYSPGFTIDALEWLVSKDIKMLVTDAASVEQPLKNSSGTKEGHFVMFRNDIPIVECACNMWMLRKNRLFAAALPLSINGLDASPVRVLAIERW